MYAQAGIPFYLLIDPELRALETLALRDGVWVELGVFDDTAVARIAPFDTVELEIGRLKPARQFDRRWRTQSDQGAWTTTEALACVGSVAATHVDALRLSSPGLSVGTKSLQRSASVDLKAV